MPTVGDATALTLSSPRAVVIGSSRRCLSSKAPSVHRVSYSSVSDKMASEAAAAAATARYSGRRECLIGSQLEMGKNLNVSVRSLWVLTKVRVRFGSSSSQLQKIWVRFGFGSYILSFEFCSVLYEFGCLTVLKITVP